MNKREKEIIQEVTRILKTKLRPSRIILFGSRAKGKGVRGSDFDFAVLFDKELSGREKNVLKLKMIAYLTDLLGTDKVDVRYNHQMNVLLQHQSNFLIKEEYAWI